MRYRKEERLPIGGEDPADDLDAEIQSHLDMRAEALMVEGLSPEEARAEALRRFGDVEGARQALAITVRRGARRVRWAEAADRLLQDVRHALRSARRATGFTALWVLILCTATALTAMTFAVTDHVLLRPLAYPDASRLVTLQSVGEMGPFNQVSMPNWFDWRERNTTLDATALYRTDPVTIDAEEPFRVEGATVHGEFWETLGAPFVIGRAPTGAEVEERERLVVISESLRSRMSGQMRSLEGLRVTIHGSEYRVSGVVADRHAFPEGAQLWISYSFRPGSGGMRNNINYEAIARLRAGVTIEQAASDLSGIARGIQETDPEALYSHAVGVISLHARIVGAARRSIELLMAAVLLVMLVACANLAGLALARARRAELDVALRLALGAGRGRLARQALVEHTVRAAAGGAAGLFLAWVAAGSVRGLLAGRIPLAREITIDTPVIAFTLAVVALAALITSAGPALSILRGRTAPAVHAASGRIRGGRGVPGFVMVTCEVALATALMVGGGLLVRSFAAAASRPLGYDAEDVVTLDVTLTSPVYADARLSVEYWTRLLEQLRAHPGVTAAAAGNWIPTGGGGTSFLELEGGAQGDLGAGYRVVTDDYLEAMGIELLDGRTFAATDALGTQRVGLVNRAFADRYWPGASPLGKRIRATSMEAFYHGGNAPWITVVGVVGDVRHYGFEEDPRPELFVLYRQVPDWTRSMTAVVRVDPRSGTGPDVLRAAARAVDPSLAVEATTLEARVRRLLSERRLLVGALWSFAGIAVLLTTLGVYALISYAAEERRPELAIRAALGATHRGILGLMLRDAGRLLALGVGLGVAVGSLLMGLLESLLLDVSTSDPASYASAAALIAVVGVGAALLPSWRAAKADPLATLSR
jgi:predicted permease